MYRTEVGEPPASWEPSVREVRDEEVVERRHPPTGAAVDVATQADPPSGLSPQNVLAYKRAASPFTGNPFNSKYGALYYPWIEVMNPLTNQPMLIPPSGHVAGVWCRTDSTRGVHKAPANEVTMGVNGLGFQITQAEQGGLNKVGINCIRSFPGRGIRIWSARTFSEPSAARSPSISARAASTAAAERRCADSDAE